MWPCGHRQGLVPLLREGSLGPDPLSGVSYDCETKQTVAMGADRLCLMRTAHATFPSDTTHCPLVTSKSVCPTTLPDCGFGLWVGKRQAAVRLVLFSLPLSRWSSLSCSGVTVQVMDRGRFIGRVSGFCWSFCCLACQFYMANACSRLLPGVIA